MKVKKAIATTSVFGYVIVLLNNKPKGGIDDARYEKVREGGKVVSKRILVPVGIDSEDYRDIPGVYVADSESETSWGELFDDLKQRGLTGVKLVVSDQHKGLIAAISRYFDGANWQRCVVHYMRNIANSLKRKDRKAFLAVLKSEQK